MIKNIQLTCFTILTFLTIFSCNTNKENRKERIYINSDTNLIEEKIAHIENGLMHAVLLADQPIKTFSIYDRMDYYDVPGLSIAIIKDNQIEWAKSYGVKRRNSTDSVSINTLFQAASLSKPITALVVLKLVEQGKIDLDSNINNQLNRWKIPENAYTVNRKITPKDLILHTSGLEIPHFPGYTENDSLPTLIDILNGENNSNTEAATVHFEPYSKWSYSGAGYVVLQLLLMEKLNMSFSELMQEELFNPLEISNSTFEQENLLKIRNDIALAHLENGEVVENGYHLYPEMAAAGLWTTPMDYAKIVCEIQNEYQGNSNLILSEEMAKNALSRHYWHMALGFIMDEEGDSIALNFSGGNHGYICDIYSYLNAGSGAIIMSNSNNAGPLIESLFYSISKEYKWSNWKPDTISPEILDYPEIDKLKGEYTGLSRDNEEFSFIITGNPDSLVFKTAGREYPIYAVSETKFVIPEQDWKIWTYNSNNKIDSVKFKIDLYGRGIARRKN